MPQAQAALKKGGVGELMPISDNALIGKKRDCKCLQAHAAYSRDLVHLLVTSWPFFRCSAGHDTATSQAA